jgi:hypothetical protein
MISSFLKSREIVNGVDAGVEARAVARAGKVASCNFDYCFCMYAQLYDPTRKVTAITCASSMITSCDV